VKAKKYLRSDNVGLYKYLYERVDAVRTIAASIQAWWAFETSGKIMKSLEGGFGVHL